MIPGDHICFLVDSFVEELDFTEFEKRYEGAGHPAYHPRIICKILIQSMLNRVRSSRSIARNVRENVVYIYLAEKLTPDFRTISDFRKNNTDLLKQIFKQSIAAARELDMVGLEQISIDGTILKASASNNSAVTDKELTVIMKNVAFLHQKKLEPYIPPQINKQLPKNKKGISSFDISFFKYTGIKDEYICPENKILRYSYEIYDEKRDKGHRIYTGTQCKECESNSACTQRKDKIRRLKKLITDAEHDKFLEKMKTDKAKQMSQQRKQNVEPVIGNYKQNLGFREYLTRGIDTVKNEFNLVCVAVNLKKIYLRSTKEKIV